MKMSNSESKGVSRDTNKMPSEEIDMELEDEDPDTYIDTSEEDIIEEEDEEVDLENNETVATTGNNNNNKQQRIIRDREVLIKSNKTEKKLSFSVASLLGQKDEKDNSDDSSTEKTQLR